ncbi:unnamed protein product, partial [Polarella glacialis]
MACERISADQGPWIFQDLRINLQQKLEKMLLQDPSTKEFYDVFRYLIAQLDLPKQGDTFKVEGKMEDEAGCAVWKQWDGRLLLDHDFVLKSLCSGQAVVPAIMRKLKYPVEVNRSKLQAISGPNTWPQLLAVLDWLTVLVRINDDLIEPLAACQLGLTDPADPDRDVGDHHVLRSLHENYLNFLSGKDDSSDEERLRMIYTERIEALRAEIERLESQHEEMGQQVNDFNVEHERLLDLQKAPMHLEIEADRLRGFIQAQDHKVQSIEDEILAKEAEEQEQLLEVEQLQANRAKLAEQVESQAYSKRDIERLQCERSHLRMLFKDLKAESEKAEQEVWELGMQENNRAEEIGRLVRQVNEIALSLGQDLIGEEADFAHDLRVRVDLSEPSDALAALLFEEQRSRAQASAEQHGKGTQQEEAALHEILEAQKLIEEELGEKDPHSSRLWDADHEVSTKGEGKGKLKAACPNLHLDTKVAEDAARFARRFLISKIKEAAASRGMAAFADLSCFTLDCNKLALIILAIGGKGTGGSKKDKRREGALPEVDPETAGRIGSLRSKVLQLRATLRERQAQAEAAEAMLKRAAGGQLPSASEELQA